MRNPLSNSKASGACASRGLLLSLASAALLWSAGSVSAAPLTNGNFEAATNADSATNTFPNWTENAAANAGNVAIAATTPLAGTTSALLTGTSGQVGTLTQSVDAITSSFSTSFSFAAVDPGGAGTGSRSLQLLLTGSNGGQINLIVDRGSTTSVGSVLLFSTSANAFQAIASQADKVNFSTSLANPVVNTLTLTGTVGGTYTVSTNGNTSGAVSFYQGTSNPANFTSVNFTTVNASTVNYVVDNVTLTPEPASAGACLVITAMAGLTRRRRMA